MDLKMLLEYPSKSLAAERTTIRQSTSAKLWYSFPTHMRVGGTFNNRPAGLHLVRFGIMEHYQIWARIEQFTEADQLTVKLFEKLDIGLTQDIN
jgi:hypothetical protein